MSLPAIYIEEITRILGSIATNLPGYVPRQSQKRMIAIVAEVLSRAAPVPEKVEGEDRPAMPENTGSSIACVQGPTGVGKSLAYLIGATVAARAQKRKLIVSSATVALQEQLVNRDVPFFVKNSGLNITCAIAKGRGRYVCHAKLRQVNGAVSQTALFESEDAEAEIKVSAEDKKTFAIMLANFESKKWAGDRDELPAGVLDKVWSQVTTDRHGCTNSKCEQFSTCAQMAARDSIKSADIVVANHDLLLADIALGGGVILPDPADSFYVLDEGHHIAQKAVDTFACQHHIDAGRLLMDKLSVTSIRVGQSFHELSPSAHTIGVDAEFLSDALNEAYAMFDSIDKAAFNNNVWRFPGNALPAGAESLASNIVKTTNSLLAKIAEVRESLRKEDSVLGQKLFTDIGFFAGKVESIQGAWVLLSAPAVMDNVPIAKWLVLDAKQNGRIDFIVHACPAVAGKVLADTFFKKAAGVIVTSATLMTLGNFDQLLRESGLDMLPDTSLVSLPSPFNHAEQGVLSIPDIKASAKDQAAHTKAIAASLPTQFAETGNKGTLVLFSSRKQMNDVAALLPADVRAQVLIQGDRSKDALLADHHRRIEAGQASVLFGLQSFAEGLDLPGDACTHVVIAKLPFAVPNDPVQETLAEWLASQNKSYFTEIAVPQACLRMIQAAGRLIRTETDTGILTVLDDRLAKTQYGRQILAALPPFRRVP